MNYKNHMVFGVACGLGAATYLGQAPHPLGICVAGLAALLPDVDHPSSVVGRWVPILPRLMSHRGVTHSLFALALLAWGLWAFASHFPPWRWTAVAAFVGYASSILGDMLTLDGVRLFWPLKLRVRVPILWKSGGWHESVFNTVALGSALYFWVDSRPILTDMQAWIADAVAALNWVSHRVLPVAAQVMQQAGGYVMAKCRGI